MTNITRRQFVTVVAAAGGGLLLGYRVGPEPRAAVAATPPTFASNAFIRVAADGSVTLVMPQVEMGQGTYTSLPMLIAEELEVAPEHIRG